MPLLKTMNAPPMLGTILTGKQVIPSNLKKNTTMSSHETLDSIHFLKKTNYSSVIKKLGLNNNSNCSSPFPPCSAWLNGYLNLANLTFCIASYQLLYIGT